MKLFLDNHFIAKIKTRAIALAILFLVYSCATHKPQYGKNVSANENENATDTIKIAHTFYLVGDAGNADEEQAQQRLEILAESLVGALGEILSRSVDPIQQFANEVVHCPALFFVAGREVLDRSQCRRPVRIDRHHRSAFACEAGVVRQIGRPLARRGLLARRAAPAGKNGQGECEDGRGASMDSHSYRSAFLVFDMSVSLRWFSACSDCTPAFNTPIISLSVRPVCT